jgi:hypothetical protein
MAVTGVSNLSELVSNQSLGQGQEAAATVQPGQPAAAGATTLAEDTFTPSTQNNSTQATAQAAGLFQVSQSALANATADILSAQTASAPPAQNPVPASRAQTTTVVTAPAGQVTSPNVQTPAPAAGAPAVAVAQVTTNGANTLTPPPPPAAAPPTAPPQANTGDAATAAANTQAELQSLNSELLAQGVNNSGVQEIDWVATLTKDYNPSVYNGLVQQFEAQPAPTPAGGVGSQKPPASPGAV